MHIRYTCTCISTMYYAQGCGNIEPTAGHFGLFLSFLSCSSYTLYTVQFHFTRHLLDLSDNVLHDWLFPHPWLCTCISHYMYIRYTCTCIYTMYYAHVDVHLLHCILSICTVLCTILCMYFIVHVHMYIHIACHVHMYTCTSQYMYIRYACTCTRQYMYMYMYITVHVHTLCMYMYMYKTIHVYHSTCTHMYTIIIVFELVIYMYEWGSFFRRHLYTRSHTYDS